jgi:LPXTG-site transpeptidase (sortase) family protein
VASGGVLWYNEMNILRIMTSDLHQKRKKIHQRVVIRIAEVIGTLSAFVVIFSTLMILSNWPAYSRIIQDWIDPQAMAQRGGVTITEVDEKTAELNQQIEAFKPSFEGSPSSLKNFSLASLGQLHPDEMRLEVPKVFEGTIPVKTVEAENFDFKDLYTSENIIQESLREGVVHYPYTANPDQYGNVFITGHSSYYPWDKGRYKDIFALLHKLEIGDEYSIYYNGKKFTYRVREIFEVKPDDISVLEQPTDQKISTLMTCTPVGTVLKRLIVRADLVE